MLNMIRLVIVLLIHTGLAHAREEALPVVITDHLSLKGVLTLPEDGSIRGAVVILQGSGNIDSDGDVSGPFTGTGYKGAKPKLSQEIAQALAAAGIASLRYDKRGFADPAELPHQTMQYLIGDAISAFTLLQSRYPTIPIGWVGFSEGALVATHAAANVRSDALFLLSLPSRPIDEILAYQFAQWPVELLKNRLDLDQNGSLEVNEYSSLDLTFKVPFLGVAITELDADHDLKISVTKEILTAYSGFLTTAMGLMKTPPYADWYLGLKNLTPFAEIAPKVDSPVFLYQAEADAQVYSKWIESDRFSFAGKTNLRRFSELGHCFSPFEGTLGDSKTSGPLSEGLLSSLVNDVREAFLAPLPR